MKIKKYFTVDASIGGGPIEVLGSKPRLTLSCNLCRQPILVGGNSDKRRLAMIDHMRETHPDLIEQLLRQREETHGRTD